MASLEIDPSDVIRLIGQFLKNNQLPRTFQALQEETCVGLNTVDSIESFVQDINSGHWDVVLRTVKVLKVPDNKLIDLYEQIALELIESRETRAANWLLHKTEPMIKLKSDFPDRYVHLQSLLGRSFFDQTEAYRNGSTKEKRRNDIANSLKREVTVVPPQRLLTLLSDALKWQKQEGLLPSSSSIDIFTGKAHIVPVVEETHPTVLHRHCIKPLKNLAEYEDGPIFVCCADFSPDGQYLVVGYSTGLIEFRNSTTGRLANDLKYQAQKTYIVTPSKNAALSLCFNGNEMLAIGDKSGDISVWRPETGQLVQLFKAVHHKSVSCLVFHKNGKEILSGGHDTTVKLHGMRSNRTIRDFRGHKMFVNAVAFSRDDNYVLSGASDYSVKIWNAKTAQMLQEYKCPARVHSIIPLSSAKSDLFIVGNRSRRLHIIDVEGKMKLELCDDKSSDENKTNDVPIEGEVAKKLTNFNATCSSPKGSWIYAVDSNGIYCFNYQTKEMQKRVEAHCEANNDLIGVKHHPYLNLLATFDTQGSLKLWVP